MARRKISGITARLFFGLFICVLLPTVIVAQDNTEKDSTEWITLKEVEVNVLALSNSKFEYGGMIGSISEKKLAISDPTIAQVEMNKIPGVYWHSGALNTNRITIRGIGSRSPFSTNKIRAYYGDIPLTDGGGETTLEDIDLNFVGNLEIQKGANSSLYGSGLGGTIFLRKPELEGNLLKTNASVGSFGQVRYGVVGQNEIENGSIQLGYQSQTSDGYRDNNSFERQTIFSSASTNFERSTLDLLVLYLTQRAFIPSSLGTTDFNQNPRNAAFTWGAARGFEDYRRWLVGLSWEYQISNDSRFITSVYSIGRDAFEPRPFNILDEENLGFGLRSRWEKTNDRWSLSIGSEAYLDTYKGKIFENLEPTNGSLQGQQLSQTRQPRKYINLFGETKVDVATRTTISAGLNFNLTSYKIESGQPLISTSNTLGPIISPRVSITQGINDEMNVFATISHGFSPLSVDDSTNPDGSLNTDLEPETGWNREIGFKRADGSLNLELSLYSMDIRNLLVTRRTAEDIIFGVNAGRTIHNGIELDLEALLINGEQSQLIADFSYSLSAFEFKEFVDDQSDFSGNELTGVPRNQINVDLRYDNGWFFSGIEYQFVDEIPVTDANDVFSKNYQLVNLHLGANAVINERWSASLIGRINNIFDEKYASMLSINANAFGGNEPRYFYPGLPVNYQINGSLTFTL